MIHGTPGLRLPLEDPQSIPHRGLCLRCGGEMYPGEISYLWQDRLICSDCFRNVVTVWLEESAREVAAALGVEMRSL